MCPEGPEGSISGIMSAATIVIKAAYSALDLQAEMLAGCLIHPPRRQGDRSCNWGGVKRASLVGKAVGGTVTLNNVSIQPEIGLPCGEEREAGGWRGGCTPLCQAREHLASTAGGRKGGPGPVLLFGPWGRGRPAAS